MELYSGKEWSLPEYGKTEKSSVCVWEDRWSVFVWKDSTLYIHNALNGELMGKRKTRDSIVKVVYCSFNGYGTCIAALLHDGCQIWDEGGDGYMVSLPCRMSTVFSIRNGLLFERIDDAQLTNTSFNLTSTLHAFPNYFSLSSPLSLPKPIFQSTTEGSFLNQSILDLSRILNVSEMDVLNSRLDDSSEEDISIIASLSPWNLTVIYDKVQRSHYVFQLISLLDAHHGLDVDALLETALTAKPSISDSFIQLLNIPEYGVMFRFSIESETPFRRVILTAGIYESKNLYLYCQQQDHIRCFSFPRSSLELAGGIGETVELTEVSEMAGTLMDSCGFLECVPIGSILDKSVLISTDEGPQFLLDGMVSPIPISLHDAELRNGRYFCHSRFLLEMAGTSIRIFPAEVSMDPKLLRFLSRVSCRLSSFPAGELTEEMRNAYEELAGKAWLAGEEEEWRELAGRVGGKGIWEEVEEWVEKEECGELAGEEVERWMRGLCDDDDDDDGVIFGYGCRIPSKVVNDTSDDDRSVSSDHCSNRDHDISSSWSRNHHSHDHCSHSNSYHHNHHNHDNHDNHDNHSTHPFPPTSPLLQEIQRLFTFPPSFPSHSQKRSRQSPPLLR